MSQPCTTCRSVISYIDIALLLHTVSHYNKCNIEHIYNGQLYGSLQEHIKHRIQQNSANDLYNYITVINRHNLKKIKFEIYTEKYPFLTPK